MGADWSIYLKQAGIDKDQCIDLYGVDARILNSIDMEFYYAGEHQGDPLGIGKEYDVEDISQMLEDMEEFSHTHDQPNYLDAENVLADKFIYKNDYFKDGEEVYNIMVAECLRGNVFNEIGDIVNICIKKNNQDVRSEVMNLMTDTRKCFKKLKARVVATSRKFPGFFKFSGYKQVNVLCPDIIMTKR